MKSLAAFRRGLSPNSVVITPGQGASLRTLERALQAASIHPALVLREEKQVHIHIDDAARAARALSDWEVAFDRDTQMIFSRADSRAEKMRRAKSVLQHVAEPGVAEGMLSDFEERSALDLHQLEAVAALTHSDVQGLCLFDEQGLGKTVTTLYAFHRLFELGDVSKMLVVAPKNMIFEWGRDCQRFFGDRHRVQAVSGSEREKRAALDQPADIYVTNFETTVGLSVKLRDLLKAENGHAFLVVDESFFVKNAAALRTQSLRDLRRWVDRCVVLCGTPAPNSPHDLIEQFNIADGGFTFEGVTVPDDREAATKVIQRAIDERGVYLRRLKQQVLPDLPGKTFQRILVPLQPEQRRAYMAALQDLVVNLRSTSEVAFKRQITSFLARRMALLQLCSNPSSVLDDYSETPAKLLALDSILEELIARRREKVIVWSFFTATLDAIQTRFARFFPVRIDGTVTRAEDRREAVRRFQEDDSTMLFVANPAAAGAGLTLHRARFAVYESMSNQAAHYLQSLDRIHRRGQTRAVDYLILLCDQTIEITEYERLIAKEEAAQQLLGDEVTPPLTRSRMLSEVEDAARMIGLDLAPI